MSYIISVNIEREVQRLSQKLEDATDELQKKAVEAANAEVAHKREYAKAVLTVEGRTQAERDANAIIQTIDEFQARMIAAALHTSQLEACRSRRAQLSALQTLLRVVREQT